MSRTAAPDGIVTATYYEIGRDFYGRKPSGKEVRLLRKAIENLAGALVSIGGFNAHTGERKPKLVSLVHLVESAVWGEDLDVAVPTRADAAKTGAMRGNSIEIKLAAWLLPQLNEQYVTYLDWRIQRKLEGLSKRLWVYLEAERFKGIGDGREASYIILGDKAYTALGVRHGRARARGQAHLRGRRALRVDRGRDQSCEPPHPPAACRPRRRARPPAGPPRDPRVARERRRRHRRGPGARRRLTGRPAQAAGVASARILSWSPPYQFPAGSAPE
jgi:hypothetical protein